MEVYVLPVGPAEFRSNHYAGSVLDLIVMSENKYLHLVASRKLESETNPQDIGDLSEEYPLHWDILCYKGY